MVSSNMARLKYSRKIVTFVCLFVISITYFFLNNPTQHVRLLANHQIIDVSSSEGAQDNFPGNLFHYLQNLFKMRKSKDRNIHINDPSIEDVQKMTQILNKELGKAKEVIHEARTKPACDLSFTISNSCDQKCLRLGLSEINSERIFQLLSPAHLRITEEALNVLQHMRSQISGKHDTILLTGASSNHFLESQALLKNVHENLFPHLKDFKLIYYNLGLTPYEKHQLEMHCRCIVVDFPFHLFPSHFNNLRCYSWKPFMIKAHAQQANVLMWLDASVRFENASKVHKLLNLTKERGLQIPGPSEKSPFRTTRSMYHFFGDEPCSYLQMGQLHATLGFYKNDPFIERTILEPWTACAWNKSCICPDKIRQRNDENTEMIRKWREEGGQVTYGLVHRFDQSAISLIVHKVYYKYYFWVMFRKLEYGIDFLRNDKIDYFPPLNS